MDRKPATPSAESIARANRQRLAHEDGARAMADADAKAVSIRKNMERLRALRQARDAEEASTRPASPDAPKKKRKQTLSK